MTSIVYLVDIIVYFVELDEDVKMKNEFDVLDSPKTTSNNWIFGNKNWFTFCLIVCRFESSVRLEEPLAGELWLRCGCWIIFDDLFIVHVQDLIELEDDDEELLVVVIGVLDGQSTQEVEWRKSVGRDLHTKND